MLVRELPYTTAADRRQYSDVLACMNGFITTPSMRR
jgi:hypothetical protein